MAQKLGIVILLFVITGLSAVIYWHLKFNNSPQPDTSPVNSTPNSVNSNDSVTVNPVDTTPDSADSTKPLPSEEQITEQVEQVLEKIKVEGASRRLTSSELMYLSNPRQAAIQDLTK